MTYELHKLPTDIFSEEIERAKAQLKASLLMARESTSNRAEALANQLLVHNRVIDPEEIVANVDAIDAIALAQFAEAMLASPKTRAVIGPSE